MNSKNTNLTTVLLMIEEVDALFEMYKNLSQVDYSVPVSRMIQTSELILYIILQEKKEKLGCESVVFEGDVNSMLEYYSKVPELLPQEYYEYVQNIKKVKEMSNGSTIIPFEYMLRCKDVFDGFVGWFTEKEKISSNGNEQVVDYLVNLGNEKRRNLVIEFNKKMESSPEQNVKFIKRVSKYYKIAFLDHKTNSKDNQSVIDQNSKEMACNEEPSNTGKSNEMDFDTEVLKKMEKIFVSELSQVKLQIADVANDVKDIDVNVRSIKNKLNKLSHQVVTYKSLVNRQIQLFEDDEQEKEHIIHAYIDECAEKIACELRANSGDVKKEEETKLQEVLGEGAWGKLEKSSKDFLVSAKVVYRSMTSMNGSMDYSGVCVLVTKALEVELSKRFFTGFKGYLKEKYPGKSGRKEWPMGLLGRTGMPLTAEKFSMGNVSEILCKWHDPSCNEVQKENNKQKLLEYAKDRLFENKDDDEILDSLWEFADEIEIVKNKYRNPSAHTGELSEVDAKGCLDFVIDVEKLLKRMLDSFKY